MKWLYPAICSEFEVDKLKLEDKDLVDFFKGLPEDERQIATLYYEEEISVKEIAKRLNYSVSTVYKKLNTAIFKLKMQFNPEAFTDAFEILYPEGRNSGINNF